MIKRSLNAAHSPLVDHAAIRLLKRIRVDKLISDWQSAYRIDVSEELKGFREILLYECEVSGLDFFWPPSVAGSDKLYSKLENFDWFYMPKKWEFDQAINDLQACGHILEVGCGPGFFLETASRELKGSVVKGIELSETAVRTALSKKLLVQRVELQDLAATSEKYDAVCSFQVLEHVSRPKEFIHNMVSLLRPGGKLILSVPNKDSFLRLQYNLLDMPPHHMTRWNVFTLRYVENIFPLRVLRVTYEPLSEYHAHGYINAYARYWGNRFPAARNLICSNTLIRTANGLLQKEGLRRFLRGQSLYVVFVRL